MASFAVKFDIAYLVLVFKLWVVCILQWWPCLWCNTISPHYTYTIRNQTSVYHVAIDTHTGLCIVRTPIITQRAHFHTKMQNSFFVFSAIMSKLVDSRCLHLDENHKSKNHLLRLLSGPYLKCFQTDSHLLFIFRLTILTILIIT